MQTFFGKSDIAGVHSTLAPSLLGNAGVRGTRFLGESVCAAFWRSNSLDVSRSGASSFHQMLVCAAFRRHRFSRARLLALSRARTFSDRNTICTRDPPCSSSESMCTKYCARRHMSRTGVPNMLCTPTLCELRKIRKMRNTICTRDPPCEKLRHTV